MCIVTGGSAPKPQKVKPAPTRESIAAKAAAGQVEAVTKAAKLVADRQGVFGNITTTPLGDASYGTASYARFGAAA